MAALVVAGLLGFLVVRIPMDPRTPVAGAEAGGGGGGSPVSLEPAPRCRAESGGGHRIGPAQGSRPSGDGGGVDAPDLEPFAVELGRGDAVGEGYAVGLRRDKDGVTVAEVARVSADARRVELIGLGRALGDVDAPTVRSRGKSWVAAVMEPHASGLALRLVAPAGKGDELMWGAEIEQGSDESLALDVAFSGDVGVVVWDDVTEDGKRGRVMRATIKAADLSLVGEPQPVDSEGADAELPRLVARPGGFWLAYVARAEQAPRHDGDERFAAERIEPSWLELMPLDRHGEPEGAAQRVTPQDEHVLGFDLTTGREGAAILAWRDDDTPSGAHGGRVRVLLVGPSGGGVQEQLVADKNVGSGVPALVPGWLALVDDEGRMRLAPMSDEGQVLGELVVEPLLGRGQVIAARGGQLLVARPDGRAVELASITCRDAADGGS